VKILIVGKNISKNNYGDNINFVKPLIELGNDVKTCDLEFDSKSNSIKIIDITKNFEPNLTIFIPVQEELDLEFIKEFSNKNISLAYFYDDTWRINYSIKWSEAVSYIVTSDVNWKLNFENIRHKVIYAPFFINCKEYRDYNIKYKRYDVTFVGQYHPYREWMITKIRNSGINVNVFGHGWGQNSEISFNEMIEVFNNSKINLNLSNCVSFDIKHLFDLKNNTLLGFLKSIKLVIGSFYKSDMKLYEMVKARFFEINACGGFQLAFYSQGLEHQYEIGKDLEIFASSDELLRKIQYYLNNEEERDIISRNGYKRTIQSHDSKIRLSYILSKINFT